MPDTKCLFLSLKVRQEWHSADFSKKVFFALVIFILAHGKEKGGELIFQKTSCDLPFLQMAMNHVVIFIGSTANLRKSVEHL